MKMSTRGRYGLRAMLDLALHSQETQVPISHIAQRQSISENYLEQLFAKLKKAGLVKSIRGAMGGYSLAKSTNTITVGDILRALEGNLNPVDCAILKRDQQCSEEDCCVTKYVWKKISDSINDTVDRISLQDLVDENFRLNGSKSFLTDNPTC